MKATKYYQKWTNYTGSVSHMLRFYFRKPDATIDEMSAATQKAWIACHRAVSKLSDSERDECKQYFTTPYTPGQIPDPPTRTVDKLRRYVAIERGLADE